MDIWAQQYFGQASFVCVSCDGPGLATAFAKRLQLSKCLLTYVDEANGPRWGQLGCNGFIVLDGNGKVACRASSAFLEVQERAFSDLEAILESILADASPSSLLVNKGVEEFDRVTGGCVKEEMPKRMRVALEPAATPVPSEFTSNKTPTTAVAPLSAIETVHVAALDAEHEECEAALAALRECPTREAIMSVIEAYSKHFKHEEELLDQHLYATDASSGDGFSTAASARRSHFADHQRMIGELRARASQLPEGGPSSGPKAWIYASSEAPAAFVHRMLRAFENHANLYDTAYAAPLAARLREADAAVAVH